MNKVAAFLALKKKALLVHIGLSSILFAVVMYLITQLWYPGPMFWADGGVQATQLVFGVDLILGPLMTLIIYSPLKSLRERVFDMLFIGVIQVGALLWGISNVYSQYPVGIVLIEQGGVQPIPYELFTKVDRPASEMDAITAPGERLAWLPVAADQAELEARDNYYWNNGVPLFAQAQNLKPFSEATRADLEKFKLDLDDLFTAFPDEKPRYEKIVSGLSAAELADTYLLIFWGYYRVLPIVVTIDGRVLGSLYPEAEKFLEYSR